MVKKSKVGRKSLVSQKRENEKKDHNTGFTLEQTKWIVDFAKSRDVSRTVIHREMADMYITSVESQKGDFRIEDLIKNMNVDVVTNTQTK